MRILCIGGDGTLGVPLVQELKFRGHHVFVADLKHSRHPHHSRCDIAKYRQVMDLIDVCRPEIVMHLGAEFGRINGERYYEQVWESNVIGTRNILEAQKEYGFKLIFASSSEIYGDTKVEELTEQTPHGVLTNDYAISKLVNEMQCHNFRQRHGNQIMVLRFFNAYGPGEFYTDYRSVCCLFCYRALHGIPYDVYENYHRVFMYISDFIPTLANTVDNFIDGETVNIGGREFRSVRELSDIVLKCIGRDDRIVNYMPEDKHNVVNKRPFIQKAEQLFGHNPETTLEEGIEKTIEWMRRVYGV